MPSQKSCDLLTMRTSLNAAVGILSILAGGHYAGYWKFTLLGTPSPSHPENVEQYSCRPYLPNLFSETPPTNHPAIHDAVHALKHHLSTRFSKGDMDSLSVAVVTSNGPLFEENFGVMRANETNSLPTHSHSVYRIASVAKLFNVLEGFILEQKGIISWYAYIASKLGILLIIRLQGSSD